MKWTKRIRRFFETKKLSKLPDTELVEKIKEKAENEELKHAGTLLEYLNDEEKRVEVAKTLVESENLSNKDKQKFLTNLPHKTQKDLFKESVKAKKIMAKINIPDFIKVITNDKNLNPYDELYYRLEDAFSDSQVGDVLKAIGEKRPEEYDEEKIFKIVGKQIAIRVKKQGVFLASHLKDLTRYIKISDDNNGTRDFDILNEEDKEKLSSAFFIEAEHLKEKIESSTDEKKENHKWYLEKENLERQVNNMVHFAKKRQEELKVQGLEIQKRGGR